MNSYESVCILAPNYTNEQISNIIVKIQDKIKKYSFSPIKVENLGKKKLAYEIKNNKEGIYLVIHFKANTGFIHILEQFYKVTEEIIKYIIVKEDINNE
ncbi:MAG: 30S ribosomal protein S6 [Clostridia bacterium]|nr:30S ribosomal protein S6 [Clostridia bacterium]